MKKPLPLHRFISRATLTSAALLTGVYVLVGTQSGLNFIWSCAKPYVPGNIVVGELRGNLMSHISVTNLAYSQAGTNVTLENFDLNWNIASLLLKRLTINNIHVKGLQVELTDTATAAKQPEKENASGGKTDLSWLGWIDIKKADIYDIKIYNNQKLVYELNSLAIKQTQPDHYQLSADSSIGNLSGNYQLTYFPRFEWQANINGKNIDFSKVDNNLQGIIQFNFVGKGHWGEFSQFAEVELLNVEGSFQKNPLKVSAAFNYDNGVVSIETATAMLANATLEIKGDLHNAWNMSWHLNAPSLAKLLPGARGQFKSDGQITGNRQHPKLVLSLSGSRIKYDDLRIANLSGDLQTHFTQGSKDSGKLVISGLRYADYAIPTITLTSATWLKGKALHNKSQIRLDAQNWVDTDIALPAFTSFTDMAQQMKGDITINLTSLGSFKSVVKQAPHIQSLQGSLTGAIKLEGRLNKPKLDGRLQLTNGSMFADKLGLKLSDIQVSADYKTGQPVSLNGRVEVGAGRLDIDGKFNIDSPALSMMLNVRGNNLQVIDSKEYKVRLSPDINLSYTNNDLFIKGKVLIPHALIAPTDFSSTQTLSGDVVIVNEKKDSAIPTNLALDVRVEMGDDVQIKYNDLKTKLLGALTINQRPGNPPTATGELSIKTGTYKAYGRELNIEQGRLIYTGNLLANPGLSLRATQTIKTVNMQSTGTSFDSGSSVYGGQGRLTVGVSVRGTLDKPILSLFSSPAGLSQGDILSYLLFGKPQSQAAGASGMALLGAAGGMGGAASGLTSSLGLDELGVGSTNYYDQGDADHAPGTKTSTTVDVGKNFGSKLSVHYSVGLFDQLAIFSLRYQLSRRFVIQTETSTLENGGDILYTLESSH